MPWTARTISKLDDDSGRRGSVGHSLRLAVRSAAVGGVALLSIGVLLAACSALESDSSGLMDISQASDSTGDGFTPSGRDDAATSSTAAAFDDRTEVDAPGTSGSFEIGDEFDGTCTVAWPSSPMHTSEGTQIRTTCAGMESSEFQFVDILVLDPRLELTPSRATVRVHGQVVDIVDSEMGFTTLAVIADETEVR